MLYLSLVQQMENMYFVKHNWTPRPFIQKKSIWEADRNTIWALKTQIGDTLSELMGLQAFSQLWWILLKNY